MDVKPDPGSFRTLQESEKYCKLGDLRVQTDIAIYGLLRKRSDKSAHANIYRGKTGFSFIFDTPARDPVARTCRNAIMPTMHVQKQSNILLVRINLHMQAGIDIFYLYIYRWTLRIRR